MSDGPATNPHEQEQLEEEVITGEPAKVILFNDEVHTFDEVIGQLIRATGCSTSEGRSACLGGAHARESNRVHRRTHPLRHGQRDP